MRPPNHQLVLDAAARVERPKCPECRWWAPKTSMLMFTACDRTNRMCMPIEAAEMMAGNCPSDCPVWNERIMDVLSKEGTMTEALMGRCDEDDAG